MLITRTRGGNGRDGGDGAQRVGDEGFTLAEVVISFVLFMILAAAAGVALTGTLQLSRSNEARVVAANLAGREMETIRGLTSDQVSDGAAPTRTVVVDGRTYYLDRTATFDTAGGTGSACAGASGPAAFKRVTVTVTWDSMNGTRPVRSDTLKALPVTGISDGTGVVSVPVQDATGEGVSGLTVTLGPGGLTAVTASDGCAVFSAVAPGTSYSVAVGATGYVGRAGETTVSQTPVAVFAGQVTKTAALVYDRASSVALSVPAPAGYPVPDALGVSLGNTNYTGGYQAFPVCGSPAVPPCATGTSASREVTGLFPATAGYQAWPGTCSTARPATPPTVLVTPGALTTGTAASTGGVAVVVKQSALHIAGYTVWATNEACPSESFVLPGVSGLGDGEALRLALPRGTWSLSAGLVAGTALGSTTGVAVTDGAVVAGGTPVVVSVP